MSLHRFSLLALLSLLLVTGCGRKSSGDTTIINGLFRGGLDITANGGAGSGGFGFAQGGDAFDFSVTAGRNLFVGVNPPPLPPTLPSRPNTGTTVVSWTDDQTIDTGNAIVNGNITAATTGTDATLTVTNGDLIINGSITSANNGFIETGLVINVPAGTVWIFGTIRTGRVDGVNDGDEAGRVDILALRVIFAGTIDARGENGGAGIGGDGAGVIFDTEGAGFGPTSQILVGGSFLLDGGDASGLDPLAGDGGSFTSYRSFSSSGAIHVHGTTFSCDGGFASGSGLVEGGFGGTLDLQGDAGVFFNADYSGRGGDASATSGDAIAGDAGGLFINDFAVLDSGPVALFGSIDQTGGSGSGSAGVFAEGGDGGQLNVTSGADVNLGGGQILHRGGDSTGAGGNGSNASFTASTAGSGDLIFDSRLDCSDGDGGEPSNSGNAGFVDFDTVQGDIQLSGTILSDGGDGSFDGGLAGGPSAGGTVAAGSGSGGGSITIRATIRVNGGSDSDDSDDNDGANGGLIQFLVSNSTGSIYLDPGSLLQSDGGDAGGGSPAPFGGNGGQIQLLTGGGSVGDATAGGNISMRGTIASRGGVGLGFVGSLGGFGGEILADSDSVISSGGGDGRGGDITLHSGAVIDASGGPAGSGGDALNDGFPSSVLGPVAVTLDADGLDSDDPAENGIVLNLGTVIAQGVGAGSIGGDVLFDGLDSGLSPGPSPGFLDATGVATDGDFLSQ